MNNAWTAAPDDATEALADAVQAADSFSAAWRATVTSAAWDTLFEGAPRPSVQPASAAPTPDSTSAEPDGLDVADWAVPGITQAEQHAAIRATINDFGSLNAGVTEPGSGLAAFVRRMDNPASWRAWRDELVATQRGTWLGGSRRAEDTRAVTRVDASAEGILISIQGTEDRPAMSMVMRWEELPAWIHLGLNDETRRDLLSADAAFTGSTRQTPDAEAAWARLDAVEQTIWDAVQIAGAPTAEALAASWQRYLAPLPASGSETLFESVTGPGGIPAYTNIGEFTDATNRLITAAWELLSHPHWPAADPGTRALREALAALRAASPTSPAEAVRSILLLAQAAGTSGLEGLSEEVRPAFSAFADAARDHADRTAATAWGEEWRQVFPAAAEVWEEDPFLLARFGYTDPRPLGAAAQTVTPLDDHEAGVNQTYEEVTPAEPSGRLAYRVPGTGGFTVVAQPGLFNGPTYTLRTPQDDVVATLVKQGSAWHIVMGKYLPPHDGRSLTILPPQPPGADNFHHAVQGALRVWAEDHDQFVPGQATYLDATHVSWALLDLVPFTAALRTTGRYTWPLTHEQQPALTGVLNALAQLGSPQRDELDHEQLRAQADAIETVAAAAGVLRTQLENEELRTSELYGVVRALSGRAHEMPGRLRNFADSRTTTAPAPGVPTGQITPEAAAEDVGRPVKEGGLWEPDYPVPPTVDELWRTAQARGWTMTRETLSSQYGGADRFNVFLEAHTTVGHWKFNLQWGLRKGRYAADKQNSSARWPDNRGDGVRPTVAEALNAMVRYAAIPAPDAQATPQEAEQVVQAPGEQAPVQSATPSPAAETAPADNDGRYGTRDVEGMPGYWWREEPPRATDRYTTERVTVGFGEQEIGEAHGPGWQDRTAWTIPDGTELLHGGQTSAESAKKLAERHHALRSAAGSVTPAPAAVEAGDMPFDAQEVEGVPGYWWRLEPPDENSREGVERVSVGQEGCRSGTVTDPAGTARPR